MSMQNKPEKLATLLRKEFPQAGESSGGAESVQDNPLCQHVDWITDGSSASSAFILMCEK